MEQGVGGVARVWLVLGELDPIIVREELDEDARVCLGNENVEVRVVPGVGHEVAIERAGDVVSVVGAALGNEGW
jgi:pimeloyl-ACP methyl ester carboxylesterase